jgi:hyperosmotically inducible protein
MTKVACIAALALAGMMGCSSNKAPDIAGDIRTSLKQAGLNDVTVSQDRDRGVVTLGGNVKYEADKSRAEDIARPMARGQMIADQIAVLPPGNESTAKDVNSDIDKAIEANLDAAFTQNNMKDVHHSTKNGVVTLKGNVATQANRTQAERTAAAVPNVQQVVNELDVRGQRTTSGTASRSR